MFYIKAMQGTQILAIAPPNQITVTQPLQGWPLDTAMEALILMQNEANGWIQPATDTLWGPMDSLTWTSTNYIFTMYQFNYSPGDSGSWCNSDNPTYFSAFPQTVLNIVPLDSYNKFQMQVYLVFNDVNAMVHVYYNNNGLFPYMWSPVGLSCTLVAVGVSDGKLYSCFKPFTTTANQTVNFSMEETTSATFMQHLNMLN
jgi:hypothetical protein